MPSSCQIIILLNVKLSVILMDSRDTCLKNVETHGSDLNTVELFFLMLKNSHFEDKGRKRPLRVFPFFTHTIKCICLKSAIGVLTTMYTNNHCHCQDFHPFKKSSLTPLPSINHLSLCPQSTNYWGYFCLSFFLL